MRKILHLVIAFLMLGSFAFAQSTTINTTVSSTGYTGTNSSGANGFITFVVENTSGMDVILTDVGNWSNSGHNGSTATLWYSNTSLSGAPTLATPTWNVVATATISGLGGTLQVNPMITGMSFIIPSGATYRFALHNNTGTNYYSGSGVGTASPNTFTGGGVTMRTGDYQISGMYVGYGATNNPRFFTGSITFKPAGVPCTGVPTTSISGIEEICPEVPFNLTLQPTFQDATFIWEYSVDGLTWVTFTGTVNAFGALSDAIKVPTWYRATVKCNATGLTYTTPAHFVDISKFYYCYCANSSNAPLAGENKVNIGRVKIATMSTGKVELNNTTITGSQVNNPAVTKNYSDFRRTLDPVKMYQDSNFTFNLSQYNSGATIANATVIAYLDYDRNGIFDDYERIHFSKTLDHPVPGEFSGKFRVHDTAHIGITGMRIIIKNGITHPDSCGNYVNGETEDYLADIRYIPCSGNTNAGIAQSPDTTVCPGGYTYIVTDSTYEKKRSELSKIWQVSADNMIWSNINNSSIKDTLMRTFTGQPLHYRLKMVCEATEDTSYSNVLKINNKPSYKCYCFSKSTGGRSLDSSDAGGLKIAGFTLNQGGSHLLNPSATQSRQDYTDNPMIDIQVDSSYQLNIYHTMPRNHHSDAKVTLFIDFNNNHQYDIPEDRVYTGFTSTSTFVLTPNIYIPNDAIVGVPTGMRLIVNDDIGPNAASDNACGTYISGETEDYMIMFHRAFATNVNQAPNIRNLSIYPNPGNGNFTVELQPEGNVKEIAISITTITGQQLYRHAYPHHSGIFSQHISLEGATPGIYLVEVTAGGQKQTQKLIIR